MEMDMHMCSCHRQISVQEPCAKARWAKSLEPPRRGPMREPTEAKTKIRRLKTNACQPPIPKSPRMPCMHMLLALLPLPPLPSFPLPSMPLPRPGKGVSRLLGRFFRATFF